MSMKRSARLHVMLTDEEKLMLEAQARERGTSMSVWLRLLLRKSLGLATVGT